MRAVVVSAPFLALAALAVTVRAPAAEPGCQSFTRASADAPELVRVWLAHSSDVYVRVCMPAGSDAVAVPLYSGESALAHEGEVCSYASHALAAAGSGSRRRLRRYERGDAQRMALAAGPCPAPPAAYTETYDVSAPAFVAMMHLWNEASASARIFDAECCEGRGAGERAPAAAARLRMAIGAGRLKGAAVLRIVRLSGATLHRRYALFVADPDRAPQQSTLYVIYLSRWIGGPWHISGVADAAD